METPITLTFSNGREFELIIRESNEEGTFTYEPNSNQLDEVFDALYQRQFLLLQEEQEFIQKRSIDYTYPDSDSFMGL